MADARSIVGPRPRTGLSRAGAAAAAAGLLGAWLGVGACARRAGSPPPQMCVAPGGASGAPHPVTEGMGAGGAAGGLAEPTAAARPDGEPVGPPPFLEPTTTLRCVEPFPHAYRFTGTSAADHRALFRIIWLDGTSRGDNVVALSFDAPLATDARCIAVGPHRDLNLANWCCRDRPRDSGAGNVVQDLAPTVGPRYHRKP